LEESTELFIQVIGPVALSPLPLPDDVLFSSRGDRTLLLARLAGLEMAVPILTMLLDTIRGRDCGEEGVLLPMAGIGG
jgi:hypothetical protein